MVKAFAIIVILFLMGCGGSGVSDSITYGG